MGLTNKILLSTIFSIFSIFFTNFVIINNLPITFPIPNIFILMIVLSIQSFFIGYYISYNTQYEHCGNQSKKFAMKQGLKHLMYSIIGYLVVYFVSFVRDPFLQIFGKGPLGFSIAQSFIISLNIIMVTIINYFNSIKSACKVPQKDIEKNLKKLDRYLKKKPKKKKKRLITIRN
jgi:hypothetical protein